MPLAAVQEELHLKALLAAADELQNWSAKTGHRYLRKIHSALNGVFFGIEQDRNALAGHCIGNGRLFERHDSASSHSLAERDEPPVDTAYHLLGQPLDLQPTERQTAGRGFGPPQRRGRRGGRAGGDHV